MLLQTVLYFPSSSIHLCSHLGGALGAWLQTMVRSSEELQDRANRMVAEAAAQSVAMVEEASMTSRHKDHTVDRYRRIIASVQAEVRRLTAQVREQEEAKVKLEKVRAGCTRLGGLPRCGWWWI